MPNTTNTAPTPKRPRRMAREPKAEVVTAPAAETSPAKAQAAPVRGISKAAQVLGMLQRREGATMDQLTKATGWLPHTTRAALTGLRKKGHSVSSEKVEGGQRIYRVAGVST